MVFLGIFFVGQALPWPLEATTHVSAVQLVRMHPCSFLDKMFAIHSVTSGVRIRFARPHGDTTGAARRAANLGAALNVQHKRWLPRSECVALRERSWVAAPP